MAEAWGKGSHFQAAAAQILVAGGILMEMRFIPERQLVQLLTLVAFCAAVCFGLIASSRLGSALPSRPPLAVFMSLWIWLMAVDIYYRLEDAPETILVRTLSGIVLAVFLFGQMRARISIVHVYSAAIVSLVALAVSLPFIAGTVRPCSAFKCGAFGFVLAGPFSSGNYMGLCFAILGALVVLAPLSRPAKTVVFVFVGTALIATVARTSMLALAIALVVYLTARSLERSTGRAPSSFVAGLMALAAAAIPMAVGVYLIYTADPAALSNRGRVWMLGRTAVEDSPLTGLGLDSWSFLQEIGGVSSQHFTHSIYLLLLFSGGQVALALFLLATIRLIHTGIRDWSSVGRGVIVPLTFLVCGIAEGIWNPLTVDGLTWMFVAMVAATVGGPLHTKGNRTADDPILGDGSRPLVLSPRK